MWTRVMNERSGNVDLFRSQLNRLFSEFDDSYGYLEKGTVTKPYTNMYDNGEHFILQAAVPGVSRDELQIKIQGNYLELSESRKNETPDGYEAHRVERGDFKFTKSFTLGADVDVDKVEAELGDGILTMILPKAAAARAKQIEIK